MNEKLLKELVRKSYGRIARAGGSCCGPEGSRSCCGPVMDPRRLGQAIGYTFAELDAVPEDANLGLGCGNPVALAALKEGETVLDLGCGAGLDCFLAAERVGPRGKVIGVDMTLEMIEKARENARRGGYTNVEFRPGEIEHLPVGDGSVDVVISNCAINLSPEKEKVFREAFRVLRPAGRLAITDLIWQKEPPVDVRDSVAAYIGCLGGAMRKEAYLALIRAAGFEGVTVMEETALPAAFLPAGVEVPADAVAGIKILARKPAATPPLRVSCGCSAGRRASPPEAKKEEKSGHLAELVYKIRLRKLASVGLALGLRILAFFFAFSYLGHLINLALPTRWMMDLFGAGRFHAIPLAATLGVPLYINAEVSMPVIKSFVEMGMSPGAALALTITGAGTSIGAITGAFVIAKKRVVGLVVGSLWVGAVLAGYVYDLVLAMA